MHILRLDLGAYYTCGPSQQIDLRAHHRLLEHAVAVDDDSEWARLEAHLHAAAREAEDRKRQRYPGGRLVPAALAALA